MTDKGKEEEISEKEERLMQYKAFLDTVLDKEKHLEKWVKGLKGIRQTGLKQDQLILRNIDDFFKKIAKDKKLKIPSSKKGLKTLIQSIGEQSKKFFQTQLKERRKVDKYFDNSVENLCESILNIDRKVNDKILELLGNIEDSHLQEKSNLKIRIADLVSENEDLITENKALREGIPHKIKEIPSKLKTGTKTIACPVCMQAYEVSLGTETFKCPVCSHNVKVS